MTAERAPAWLPRVARVLAFGGVFVLLLGFWMEETRVIQDCPPGAPCVELLVPSDSAGTFIFVIAAIMLGTAFVASAWLRRRREPRQRPSEL